MGRRSSGAAAAVPAAAAAVGEVSLPAPPLLLLLLSFAARDALASAAAAAAAAAEADTDVGSPDAAQSVERLVRRWAPLVWLAPGERFFPAAVPEFLRHVTPRAGSGGGPEQQRRRGGRSSLGSAHPAWFLVTNSSLDDLVANETSFLFGRDPSAAPVPVYALVSPCSGSGSGSGSGSPRFHVTYWMFYPFSQGKALCSADLGPLGVWPLPLLAGRCLGTYREFGSHVGDWEHVSLLFLENSSAPAAMYVSAHDAGAFYRPSADGRRFLFERQEVRRGLLQRPSFPAAVRLAPAAGRPELFAARGSHGLWAAPGTHRYVRLPRLYDHSGYGTPWATWRALRLLAPGGSQPGWLRFRGRWGNPRHGCHPLASLGLHLCHYTDGPTGIPLKEPHFSCSAAAR